MKGEVDLVVATRYPLLNDRVCFPLRDKPVIANKIFRSVTAKYLLRRMRTKGQVLGARLEDDRKSEKWNRRAHVRFRRARVGAGNFPTAHTGKLDEGVLVHEQVDS